MNRHFRNFPDHMLWNNNPPVWLFEVWQGRIGKAYDLGVGCTCGEWVMRGRWHETAEPARIHLSTAHPDNRLRAETRVTNAALNELERSC